MSVYDVAIVIPTFNRVQMLSRAIDAALAQTVPCEIVVCDHGSTDATPQLVGGYGARVKYVRREIDHGPIFSWLDGVINAEGHFIHINYDDDWIDPTFVGKTLSLMNDHCAFVFTDVIGHYWDGTTRHEQADLFATGTHPRTWIEQHLLKSSLTISPGCALFRKQDVLDALIVGEIPFAKGGYRGAGPDMLMFLQPLLKYQRFGYVNEGLAHFSAHAGSITAAACKDPERMRRLMDAYNDVKEYYLRMRWMREGGIGATLFKVWRRVDAARRAWLGRKLMRRQGRR